ncbi:elongation factor P maturation arginine rhamnosyltransferase EarP [Fusobacterium sp. MFO224]|uniref:elongation factor P maturation arginine rhamnosyltransferase EarP n=1 Tax=Fusobacterium sp. MFO224 TaxID=3378070 RepID=UPI0038528DFE
MMIPKSIDIFCKIIDNYGDIGVVYRLAKELKRVYQDAKIRVILNKLEELVKVNPKTKELDYQEVNGIVYIKEDFFKKNLKKYGVSDIIIEAFGCDIFKSYTDIAKEKSKLWINLEYLSGEKWIEDFHLQESLIDSEKLKKIFYMPGFTDKSGGIILDKSFMQRKKIGITDKYKVLEKYFSEISFENKMVGTIFSYEKNFKNLLIELNKIEKDTILFIMGEKTQKSILEVLDKNILENFGNFMKYGRIVLKNMDFLSQEEYEEIISASDFNFTRGEDSIVRALILGKPFLWHIYVQDERIHMDKLNAFIDRFEESIKLSIKEKNVLQKYKKLLRDYNDRDENSLKLGNEDYSVLFEYFSIIEKICEKYSNFLTEECNLVEKLKKYIKGF